MLILSLFLATTLHAATVQNSWLGTKVVPVPVGTQFISGQTLYIHLVLKLGNANKVTVRWYRNAKLVKTTNLAGTRTTAYSTLSVKSLPGNWTVVITDQRVGFRRSHHFAVK